MQPQYKKKDRRMDTLNGHFSSKMADHRLCKVRKKEKKKKYKEENLQGPASSHNTSE